MIYNFRFCGIYDTVEGTNGLRTEMRNGMDKPYSYYVVSNPLPAGESDFTVLFAGESQTKPEHRLGPKVYDYYLIHYVISGRGVFSSHGEEYADWRWRQLRHRT